MDTLGVPLLFRNLARDTAGFRWMLIWLAVIEAVPTSNIYEWELDEEPQEQETDKSAERKSRAGGLSPYKEVQYENR